MEKKPDAVLIREEELKVLLAGMGYESIMGLFSAVHTEPQVIPVLKELTDQSQIWSDGERFHIKPALEQMLRVMGDTRKIVLLSIQGEEPVCCYCGAPLVICEQVDWQPSMLRVSTVKREEILELVEEKTSAVYQMEGGNAPTQEQLWREDQTSVVVMSCYLDGQPAQSLEGVCSVLQPPELLLSWPDGNRIALSWSKENLEIQMQQLLSPIEGGESRASLDGEESGLNER